MPEMQGDSPRHSPLWAAVPILAAARKDDSLRRQQYHIILINIVSVSGAVDWEAICGRRQRGDTMPTSRPASTERWLTPADEMPNMRPF